MKYITQEGLKQLDNYKYSSSGGTWLDNKMNPFWEGCTKMTPKWVAPNLLTFIGWLLVIFSYGNMLRYDWNFQKSLPKSAFFFAAACIFTYVTLDAMDGKQARRNKGGSPLGQLFDHGCDSFSLSFLLLAICQAVKLDAPEVFLIFITMQLSFWTSNWAEYHTGVLKTRVGQIGVTEGQFACIGVHLFSGIFGQKIWTTTLGQLFPFIERQSFINLKIGSSVALGLGSLILLGTIAMIIKTIWQSKKKRKTTGQLLSFGLLVAMQISWSRTDLFNHYGALLLVNFGMMASLLIAKIIICSVTKMKFKNFHYEIVPLIITSVIILAMDFMKMPVEFGFYAFLLCFAIDITIVGIFLYSTINQITHYLGIYVFSIEKRPKQQ